MQQIFWRYVGQQPVANCWLWRGALQGSGYGFFGSPKVLAHRFAWTLFNGAIPKDKCVLHHCDVPKCVNPAHLFIGTQRDNVLDMIAKNRGGFRPGFYRNRQHPTAKLNEALVRDMRERHAKGAPILKLARRFKVAYTTAYGVCTRRSWRSVK